MSNRGIVLNVIDIPQFKFVNLDGLNGFFEELRQRIGAFRSMLPDYLTQPRRTGVHLLAPDKVRAAAGDAGIRVPADRPLSDRELRFIADRLAENLKPARRRPIAIDVEPEIAEPARDTGRGVHGVLPGTEPARRRGRPSKIKPLIEHMRECSTRGELAPTWERERLHLLAWMGMHLGPEAPAIKTFYINTKKLIAAYQKFYAQQVSRNSNSRQNH